MQKPTALREQISQLISVRIGSNMPPLTTIGEDYDRVAQLIEQQQIGGVLLFNGGRAEECGETLRRLQQIAAIPLLVAADMERGSGQQIVDHTLWPHALAFDAMGDEAAEAVERFALWSAQQARDVGIHASFSPVADIHSNPQNPIIATRAFGTTTARVIELAQAYIRGCRAAGVLCCAKHFPGHGNTVEDSHDSLPVVRESAEELAATDLEPFRALVESGVEMFMSAHVAYPALDQSGLPATLSRPILTDLLRDKWQFQGAVVSDSLKMEGVRITSGEDVNRTEAELSIQALQAGVDLLLDVSDVDEVIAQIERRCGTDELLRARVDQAFRRAWALKEQAFAEQAAPTTVSIDRANAHARMIAQRSLTIARNHDQIDTPVGKSNKVLAVLVNPYGDEAYTRTDVLRQAFESQDAIFAARVLTGDATDQIEDLQSLAGIADCCFVAVVVKPAAWRTFGLPPELHAIVQSLTQLRPTVVASLGVAELLDEFPDAAIGVTTYSDVGVSQQALVDWMFG